MSDTPETDALWVRIWGGTAQLEDAQDLSSKLEGERDEARAALRELWQSADAFLPHFDSETIARWRKAAGWEGEE